MPRAFLCFGSLCLLLLTLGCGGAKSTVVKGKVLYNGQPAAGASVRLEKKDKSTPLRYAARTNEQGEFEIAAHAGNPMPPGRYQVLIAWLVDKKGNVPSAEDYEQLKAKGALYNKLPEQYGDPASSDRYVEIKAGENVLPPFEFKGKK